MTIVTMNKLGKTNGINSVIDIPSIEMRVHYSYIQDHQVHKVYLHLIEQIQFWLKK